MKAEGYKEFSEIWPLPLSGYYLIYGAAGAGKSFLASYLLNNKCSKRSVYISTEGELPFLNLKCEEVKTVVVNDYRQMIYVLMKTYEEEVVVLDSVSMVTRFLHPSIGSKVNMLVSWLMNKRNGFSIVISQMSGKEERPPFHEFLEPWADYVIRVEKAGSVRRVVIEWPDEERKEIYFSIEGGELKWVT